MHYSSEILDLYPMKCGFIINAFYPRIEYTPCNNLLLVMLDV